MNKKAYEICSKAKVSNDFARHEVPLVQLTDIQKDIEKMERYKKSLIYEYVTGKKRVKKDLFSMIEKAYELGALIGKNSKEVSLELSC